MRASRSTVVGSGQFSRRAYPPVSICTSDVCPDESEKVNFKGVGGVVVVVIVPGAHPPAQKLGSTTLVSVLEVKLLTSHSASPPLLVRTKSALPPTFPAGEATTWKSAGIPMGCVLNTQAIGGLLGSLGSLTAS